TVEDVEDRADDEDDRPEPVEQELLPVLEGDEHRRRETERHARRGERIRGPARAREARHRAAGERPGPPRVALLDPPGQRGCAGSVGGQAANARLGNRAAVGGPGGLAISQPCYGATIAGLRYAASLLTAASAIRATPIPATTSTK